MSAGAAQAAPLRAETLFDLVDTIGALRSAAQQDALRMVDLSLPAYRALRTVAAAPGRSMQELSLCSGIERTTLTRIMDRLIENGQVVRGHSRIDRRQVLLWPTASGAILAAAGCAISDRADAQLLKDMDPAPLKAIRHCLTVLLETMAPSGAGGTDCPH